MATTPENYYTTDNNPNLINPERGMYSGNEWPNFGSEDLPLDKRNYHTIVPEWLWLAPVCNVNVNLTWNGHNQHGTSPELNAYAAKLESARVNGHKILFRPRYDNEKDEGRASDNCKINGVPVFHAPTIGQQKDHIEAVAAMLGDYKDVIAYIQAGYLGNWGEWNAAGKDAAGESYTPANAPLLYNISQRNEIIDYVLAAYKAKNIMQHVELRRPVFAHEIERRNPTARIGFHNDCFMSNEHDRGTYENFDDDDDNPANFPNTPDDAITYAQNLTANASFGGETCPAEAGVIERWRSCTNMTDATSDPASDPASLH
ncbi:MAG: hypothetical protein AVDCRST_MAG93-4240, partial [uncultured Chloroflexia bacterium]